MLYEMCFHLGLGSLVLLWLLWLAVLFIIFGQPYMNGYCWLAVLYQLLMVLQWMVVLVSAWGDVLLWHWSYGLGCAGFPLPDVGCWTVRCRTRTRLLVWWLMLPVLYVGGLEGSELWCLLEASLIAPLLLYGTSVPCAFGCSFGAGGIVLWLVGFHPH